MKLKWKTLEKGNALGATYVAGPFSISNYKTYSDLRIGGFKSLELPDEKCAKLVAQSIADSIVENMKGHTDEQADDQKA